MERMEHELERLLEHEPEIVVEGDAVAVIGDGFEVWLQYSDWRRQCARVLVACEQAERNTRALNGQMN